MGARVREKEARVRNKGISGCGKGKGDFLGRCCKCGEAGHRKQDCTGVDAIDDDIPFSDAQTYDVESV